MNKRYWELDFLRGIAVIAMVSFHLLFDLVSFDIIYLRLSSLPWKAFAAFWANVFFSLIGVCLTISYHRASLKLDKKELLKKFLIRGSKIIGLSLIISIITYILTPARFIVFGALHFIGFSIIAGSLILIFFNRRSISLYGIPGTLLLASVGLFLYKVELPTYWLIPLGITPSGFVSLDYFPVLPWFGSITFGLWLGSVFYPEGKRGFHLPEVSDLWGILTLGRHSLPIYLLHQPVLILVLSLVKKEFVFFY